MVRGSDLYDSLNIGPAEPPRAVPKTPSDFELNKAESNASLYVPPCSGDGRSSNTPRRHDSRDSQSLFSPLRSIPRLSGTEPGILEPKPAASVQTPPRCHSSTEQSNLNGIRNSAHVGKDTASPSS